MSAQIDTRVDELARQTTERHAEIQGLVNDWVSEALAARKFEGAAFATGVLLQLVGSGFILFARRAPAGWQPRSRSCGARPAGGAEAGLTAPPSGFLERVAGPLSH